ncbi:amidohydrolase [Desulfosarcina sp.]|uniref:amidohydrolase n=1 Tax=Desulfosarcina sp. TaxID=2027861 RepID=UPI0039707D94
MAPFPSSPDLILFNGTIATQNSRQPIVQAVAIGKDILMAVGRDDEVLCLAGAGTHKVDLGGRLVVPGFIDTHIHFYEWALKRQGVRLDDLTHLEGLLERLHESAAGRPTGQWIMGQGWNESDWTEPRMPTRDLLDRAAPHHPVLLWRCDLHLAVANSAALKLARIDAGTPDPAEGRIERDHAGEPTGILRELAINLVREVVTPPQEEQILEAFDDATKALHRRGVTGIHDVRLMADRDGARALGAFHKLDRDDRLALRTWVTLPGDHLADIISLGLQTGFGNDRLRIGHVKFFSDGGMGARTAWMIDPFTDAGRGMPLMDMADLADKVRRADDAGLSVMVHAVGDRANRELVNLFTELESRRSRSGRPRPFIPHRVEHMQMIRPEDADRLRHLNLALCVTPSNMVLDMNLIDRVVGAKAHWTYAFRRLIDTGAAVMFSSDCPVCDPAPLTAIHAAVTRQRADGTPVNGWHPQNRITAAEALRAYTATPAAVHRAAHIGMIVPGKKADLAVVSENVLSIRPESIPDARVEMTLFDGRIVYRKF